MRPISIGQGPSRWPVGGSFSKTPLLKAVPETPSVLPQEEWTGREPVFTHSVRDHLLDGVEAVGTDGMFFRNCHPHKNHLLVRSWAIGVDDCESVDRPKIVVKNNH